MTQPELGEYPENLGPVFHAQLEVMTQLIRDALTGSDSRADSGDSQVIQVLHKERRQVLRRQSRDLWERTDRGGYRDPVALNLRAELGMAPADATLVAWCFATERARGEQRVNAEALLVRIGAAYVGLFRGADTFLTSRRLGENELLPLAVAVSAVRLARTRGDASSDQVELVVRRTVEILTDAP